MCGEERGKENNKNNNNNSTICKSMIHIVDERERERERQGKIISGYSRWTTIHWTDGTRMAEDLFLAPDKKVIS